MTVASRSTHLTTMDDDEHTVNVGFAVVSHNLSFMNVVFNIKAKYTIW